MRTKKKQKTFHRLARALFNEAKSVLLNFFKYGPTPASFLLIFVLFKYKFYRKTEGISGIQTRFVGVEGEHADHLTNTTAQNHRNIKK